MKMKPCTLLASLNAEALYSNIDHNLGIQAVSQFLYTESITYIEHNDFVVLLLRYLLTHNYFMFVGTFYLQFKGTAMVTVYAPNFESLFLGICF